MHRHRHLGPAVLGIVLLLAAHDAAAVSQSTAISLTFPVGSQYNATGEAGTAVARDVTAQWWNLGGFAFAGDEGRPTQAHLMYSKLVPDLADDVQIVWLGGSTQVEGWGMLGASVTYLDQGEQLITREGGQEEGTFNSYEAAIQLSYGVKVAPNLGVGIGTKFVIVDLAPAEATQEGVEGQASGWAVDFGLAYQVTDALSFGATLTNWGRDLTFIDKQQADPMPTSYRLGVGYDVLRTTQSRLTLIYDYMDMLVSGDETKVHGFGAEWKYANLLSVRGGYKNDDEGDVKDITWGFGFDLEGVVGTPLVFDYARVPQAQDLDEVNRFSLGVKF